MERGVEWPMGWAIGWAIGWPVLPLVASLRARGAACVRWVGAWLMGMAVAAPVALAQSTTPAAAAGAAPAAAPPMEAAASVELGRRTYIGMCARCHGINLVTQGIGFDLRKFPPGDRERFNKSVREGVKAMPGFGTAISPAQLDGLWAYIGSINGWK
jgi:mono/diheme cytochrome c family protein